MSAFGEPVRSFFPLKFYLLLKSLLDSRVSRSCEGAHTQPASHQATVNLKSSPPPQGDGHWLQLCSCEDAPDLLLDSLFTNIRDVAVAMIAPKGFRAQGSVSPANLLDPPLPINLFTCAIFRKPEVEEKKERKFRVPP
jgi:hypothetical protein